MGIRCQGAVRTDPEPIEEDPQLKRKLMAAGLSAVFALSLAACDADDPIDGDVTDDTLMDDLVDTTMMEDMTDTTMMTDTTN